MAFFPAQESADAAPRLTPAEVEAALAEVLARPEYAPTEAPLLYRWVTAGLAWLGERLGPVLRRLWPGIDLDNPAWETFGWALLGLGAIIGLALVAYLVHLAVRAFRRRRRAARRERAAVAAPVTAEDWEARARAAAAREEWRAAAMALYQAVLLRLSGAGALTLDRAKTPGDYRRDLRQGDGQLATRFEAFTRWFERVAYGGDEPGAEHYGRLAESAGGLAPGG